MRRSADYKSTWFSLGQPYTVKSWWVNYAIQSIVYYIDTMPALLIKGRGHAERVLLPRKNPLCQQLRSEKITGPRDIGDAHDSRNWWRGRYCLKRDLNILRDALLAIGVDADTQALVDAGAEKAAWVYWRLNGHIYPPEVSRAIGERIKAKLARKERKTLRRQFQFD